MDWNKFSSMDTSQFYFITITASFYLSIGGFGNIISILIFCSKVFKKQPVIVYLNGACFLNLVTLSYMPIMFMAPIWLINTATCKLYAGGFGFIIEVQAWITAVGSLDRLLTTMKPFTFHFKNKLSFQIGVMAIVVLFISLCIFPDIYYLDAIVTNHNVTVCSFPAHADLMWLIRYYYKIEYLLIRITIPFLAMIISSVLTTYKIYLKKKKAITKCPSST